MSLAAAPRGRRVVVAYFDPMLPAHIARLRTHAGEGKLVVLLATPSDSYLEPRARAELAASLGFVEAVILAGDVASDLRELAPCEHLRLDEEELALRAEFLRYVRERARQS